jgi:hypothetical protein
MGPAVFKVKSRRIFRLHFIGVPENLSLVSFSLLTADCCFAALRVRHDTIEAFNIMLNDSVLTIHEVLGDQRQSEAFR